MTSCGTLFRPFVPFTHAVTQEQMQIKVEFVLDNLGPCVCDFVPCDLLFADLNGVKGHFARR